MDFKQKIMNIQARFNLELIWIFSSDFSIFHKNQHGTTSFSIAALMVIKGH